MTKFGNVFSYEEIMDRDSPEYATGDISVKIKLRKDIPSFLPMYGKKIRVAYRGMKTVCSNCFDVGHIKANCESEQVSWIDYIKTLRGSGFEDELFGSWIRLIDRRGKNIPTKQAPPNALPKIDEEEHQAESPSAANQQTRDRDAIIPRIDTNDAKHDNDNDEHPENDDNAETETDDRSSVGSVASENQSIMGSMTGFLFKK